MSQLKSNIYDITIVGAGPAGLTAGIYSQRGQAKTIIIDGGPPGGKMVNTSEIENYPGFKTILGPDLSLVMYEQVSALKIPMVGHFVDKIIKSKKTNVFSLFLKDNQRVIQSRAVIIATGTKERWIGVPGEKEFYGKGVSHCAVCDAAFFKDQLIMVIGGGYAAIEEGLYLTKFARQVLIVHRREVFRADQTLVQKAMQHPKIKFYLNYVLVKIIGTTAVESAIIKHTPSGKEITLSVAAVFPFIGSDPVTKFLHNLSVLNREGYIEVNRTCATKLPGFFAAGDVTNTALRQIATATSDGAVAAQYAIFYLDHQKKS